MRSVYHRSLWASAVAAAVVAVPSVALAAPAPASAPAAGSSASALAAIKNVNASGLNQAISQPSRGGAVTSDVDGTSVTVPHDPKGGITLSAHGTGVTLGLPFAARAQDARAAGNGAVTYDNGNGTSTVPVVQKDGSVQVNTVIADASAPTSFAYPVTVPKGGSLRMENNGAVSILDGTGTWIAGVAAPWAKDANGKAVPTHFVIDGDTLTQVVEPASTTAFPVVADPWFGHTLIDHVRWENVSKWSPTAAVFPTLFARKMIALGAGVGEGDAWNEVKAKGGSRVNTPTMHTQFDCHWYFVRYRSPRKPSWDLDAKRPNVSLAKEAAYHCNYPDGGEW